MEWLVSVDNLLMVWVMVNRIWVKFFGCGIVFIIEDFGIMGEFFIYLVLLDWLVF